LQLPHPLSQELTVQDPLVQAGVAWARLQALPHPPQWLTLVCTLISQPLAADPSQFSQPVEHVKPQAPLAHVAVA
jgi:hypothetical protein